MVEVENEDIKWMQLALDIAKQGAQLEEVPVGAVLVKDGQLIASAFNSPVSSCDPTAHAEINVLRKGAKILGNYRLLDCTLYSTIEPCAMCAGAIVHARIKRLVIGATEPKAGVVQSNLWYLDAPFLNHKVEYSFGVCEDECREVIRSFFQGKRIKNS